jgi:hypothetical protein
MIQTTGPGAFDPIRVEKSFAELMALTGFSPFDHDSRAREIDERIQHAGLSLADKIEVFKRLAPRAEDSRTGALTGERKEVRMERLLLSVAPEQLPAFKFPLEYDVDYKDFEEYVFHDIDAPDRRARILEHLKRTPPLRGVKVLTDVDDTMYANLVDARYPKKTLYPGVLEFYEAVKEEPFGELPAIPITTLSARPNPIAGALEESSLHGLVEFTKQRLCPSGLSGALFSSVHGTLQTLARDKLEPLSDKIDLDQEDAIGRVKFTNFGNFSSVYPEYRYVFVGDSGQADALTAGLMVTKTSLEGTARVVTTFIHDLRQADDNKAASASFRALSPDLVVGRTSPTGHGVIVFRNYIEAAVIAHRHSTTLGDLITAEELARITGAALQAFQTIQFIGPELEASKQRLREQYRQNAEEAVALLASTPTRSPALDGAAAEIQCVLNAGF